MRNRFDQQLEQLHADLITMGGLCETAIAAAVDAATKGDGDMAKAAIADDSKIDEMERSIEHLCLKLLLQQQPVARDLRTISTMATAAISMVKEAVRSFVERDQALARKVIGDDDVVDQLFVVTKTRLIDFIAKDSTQGEYYLDLLMIAKYLERIADHATNIAEWVLFSITGRHET